MGIYTEPIPICILCVCRIRADPPQTGRFSFHFDHAPPDFLFFNGRIRAAQNHDEDVRPAFPLTHGPPRFLAPRSCFKVVPVTTCSSQSASILITPDWPDRQLMLVWRFLDQQPTPKKVRLPFSMGTAELTRSIRMDLHLSGKVAIVTGGASGIHTRARLLASQVVNHHL